MDIGSEKYKNYQAITLNNAPKKGFYQLQFICADS